MKQKLTRLKEEIDYSAIMVGYLNSQLSVMDWTTALKTSMEIEDTNSLTSQLRLVDTCRLHSTAGRTFPGADHTLGHEASLRTSTTLLAYLCFPESDVLSKALCGARYKHTDTSQVKGVRDRGKY